MHWRGYWLAIVWIASLPGCAVWPIMTRPAVQISVRDPDGRPVEGASFHFARYSISMVPRDDLSTVETDQLGNVAFSSERVWQFFFLAPDSGQFWSWSWCIEKPGYHAVIANDLRAQTRARNDTVVMVPTAETERCSWQEHPPAFEVERGAL